MNDEVYWLCTKCPRKHAYLQRISARTSQRQGCRKQAAIQASARIRASDSKRNRVQHDVAREVKAERAAFDARLDAVTAPFEPDEEPFGGLEEIKNGEIYDITGEEDIA
jgi:hypothetical protein